MKTGQGTDWGTGDAESAASSVKNGDAKSAASSVKKGEQTRHTNYAPIKGVIFSLK